ncbi:MAG: serine protease [Candidatus Acidiferrales bacterium]
MQEFETQLEPETLIDPENHEIPMDEAEGNSRLADTLEFDPYASIRPAMAPEHANLASGEITLVLGRMPAAIVLHQHVHSPQLRQATLASLIGKAARRTVHFNGRDIYIPAYLRSVSRLCREVADSSETELPGSGFAHGLQESEFQVAPDQPVSKVFDPSAPPKDVADALAAKNWPLALHLAIQAGARDENDLTNLIFFAKHPELPRGKLDPHNPNFKRLGAEWTQLLNADVWKAIQESSENTSLVVSGSEVADLDRFFWGANGKRFKNLVQDAARDVDLNPGLLGAVMMAETRDPQSYLASGKVLSYYIGTDDFYEGRAAIAARVPAYAKVKWDKSQVPVTHDNDAINPRQVQSIYFDSGPDAALATAVYLKFREVRLREIAKELKGDFDQLPIETRLALTRMAMAAGTAGVTPLLKDALQGKDILVRKAIPVKIYQTQRNGTVRAAQAMHLSEWIFGVPLSPGNSPAVQPKGTSHELQEFFSETENSEGWETAASPESEFLVGTDAAELSGESAPWIAPNRFAADSSEYEWHPVPSKKKVSNTFAVPFRWICRITIRKNGKNDGGGSGVLISDRHVLTAAHVVYDVVQDPVQYDLDVKIALDGNKDLGMFTRAGHPQIPSQYDPKRSEFDYALITLDRPVGQTTPDELHGDKLCFWGSPECGAGTVLVRVDPKGLVTQDASSAGYPKNKGESAMWCFTGMLASVPEKARTMVYTGELTEGQSGSPVWIERDGKYILVGIAVARAPQHEVVRVTRELCRQLAAWMGTQQAACQP